MRERKYHNYQEHQIWTIARQLCDGLKYLHSQNVVHMDLRSSKVFLTSDDRVKIAKDLYQSAAIDEDFQCYLAPE